MTEGLWEAAQSLLKPNEKIIKYYLWMADLETKFELVQDHCLGASLISWQEAQERLVADLDELEDKYQRSYAWARKDGWDQLRKVCRCTRLWKNYTHRLINNLAERYFIGSNNTELIYSYH